jgi:hypothetical protein
MVLYYGLVGYQETGKVAAKRSLGVGKDMQDSNGIKDEKQWSNAK